MILDTVAIMLSICMLKDVIPSVAMPGVILLSVVCAECIIYIVLFM